MALIAPPAIEVVELHLTAGHVADDRVNPIGQLHRQPFDFAAEELSLALHRLGQPQPLASGPDRGSVFDLGLDLDDMGQGLLLCSMLLRSTVDRLHGHQADDDAEQRENPMDVGSRGQRDDRAYADHTDDDGSDAGPL